VIPGTMQCRALRVINPMPRYQTVARQGTTPYEWFGEPGEDRGKRTREQVGKPRRENIGTMQDD
jgi:hypothetical protein